MANAQAEREALLARAVDQELSAVDRGLLAADPELAAEAAALTRLKRALAAEAAAPRADLADRVMRDVGRRVRRRRWLPLAAAGLAAAFAATLATGLQRRPSGPSAPHPVASAPAAGQLVRFTVDAPAQAQVALAGEFNGWVPQPLERAADGTFTARLAAAAGEWRYQLLVDGAWTDDPRATAYRPDGFGGRNAILILN